PWWSPRRRRSHGEPARAERATGRPGRRGCGRGRARWRSASCGRHTRIRSGKARMLAVTTTVILRGGRVLDPESGHDMITDVVVEDGRIAAVGAAEDGYTDATVIDVAGLAVAPGFIDLH